MSHIVLTPEQARIIAQSAGPIDVRDEHGRPVASLTPLTPEDLEIIERAKRNRDSGRPRIPSAQVQAHLRRLEEIRQAEGMDEMKMHELLRRMQAGEQV